jgi:hypothetical protein
MTLLIGVGVARSHATLIIAPATLLGQWERELRDKAVDGSQLRILKVSRPGDAEWKPFEQFTSTSNKYGDISCKALRHPENAHAKIAALVRSCSTMFLVLVFYLISDRPVFDCFAAPPRVPAAMCECLHRG